MTDTRDDFVISFKPHGGYDSPLIVVKGSTAADVFDKMKSLEASGVTAEIGTFDAALKAAFTLGGGLGATPVAHPSTVPATGYAPAAPAAPAAAPAGPPPGAVAPSCPHGVKAFKTAPPASGKTWKAWMCPAPKGTPGQCPPEWMK
ncbi:hypothetical protein AB0B57_22525 [Micromonospora sp. NPDC049101]|uniref:hypothetical protein n=1 Tax=Micromonospora sp. NPDC049101 TaxID=3155032 RepID=UPI0033FAD11B